MVIEFLTFAIDPADQDEWLAVEEGEWSRFLETRPGFVRKEMWRSHDDPGAVHAVIWWDSVESWKAITPDEVRAVDARMGRWLREPTCRSYDVVRES